MWGQLFAIATTWLITLLNILGTRNSANVQLVLTWLKGLLIVVIALFCFGAGGQHGGWHNFATSFAGARGGFSGFMIALVAALWAYDGWSDVTTMAGEVENPQRSFPLALVGGVTIVGVLYMLTNAAIQYVLPATVIAGAERPAADAMRLVAGHWGAVLVSLGMAVSIGATFVGSSLSGARVPFAAARDGLFFRQLAHVSPRFHTPSAALVLQAVLTTLLLLVIGRFQALFSLAIFAEVAVLYADGEHNLRLPQARYGRYATVQRVGVPGAAGAVYRSGGGAAGVLVRRPAAQLDRGHGDHPGGDSGAPAAAAAAERHALGWRTATL